MYSLNLCDRFVLITPDEVIKKAPFDHNFDPRQLISAIEPAEERFVRYALGSALYEQLVEAKNVIVTAANIATLQAKINETHGTTGGNPNVPISEGMMINALEFLSEDQQALWRQHLWRYAAEVCMYVSQPTNYAHNTNAGIMKNNPISSAMFDQAKSAASVELKDLQYLQNTAMQDRIEPLKNAMIIYLCKNKTKFPSFDGNCPGDCGNDDAPNLARKTAVLIGLYDDEDEWIDNRRNRRGCCD